MRDPGYVDVFNRIAPVYDAKFGKDCERAHALALAWAEQARLSPGRILDVGCGTGALLRKASLRWPRAALSGVDPAEKMAEQARKKIPHASIVMGRVEALPFEDDTFDLVLSTTSFGHWSDQAAGLKEIRRVLAPGGTCLIAEHAPPGIAMKLLLLAMNRLPRLQTPETMRGLIFASGLQLNRACEWHEGFVVANAVKPKQQRS